MRLHRHPRGLLAVVLASMLWAAPAQAEPRDDAKRAFEEGKRLVFEEQDYLGAAAQFEQAYAILPHPDVLYTIGSAYYDGKDYERALKYFQEYRDTQPRNLERADGAIAQARAALSAVQAPVAEAAPPTEAPSAPTTMGAVATEEELAQLRRHAQELQALAETLASREQAVREQAALEAADAGGVAEVSPDEPSPTPEASVDGLVPENAFGLQDTLNLGLYERVVVTASRFSQNPLEAPSAITLIDSEDIRMSGATTIPEVLAQVPGVDVMQLTAGQSDLSIRGFNRRLSNKVLVLIDGRSVYLDFIGVTLWSWLPVTLEEVDRIEVIRGPGSAIYGANAFAGVVNIITKTPGDAGTRSTVTAGAGTSGYGTLSVLASGRQRTTAYRFSAAYNQLGRWAQEVDLDKRPDIRSNAPNQNLSLQQFQGNGQLDWQIGDRGFATLAGGVSDGLIEFYSLGALRNFWLDHTSVYARGDVGWGPVHLRAFYQGIDGQAEDWYYNTGGEPLSGPLTSDVVDVTLEGDQAFGADEQHRVTVGAGYRLKSVDWAFLSGPVVEHHFNGFIQDSSTFGPVTINGAIRADRHPLLENLVASPRLAVVAQVTEGRAVRVNAGTAFRTPTFLESYTDLEIGTGIDGVVANTLGDSNLLPERVLALEAGYVEETSDIWRGEVAGYAYQVDNLINLSGVDSSTRPGEGHNGDVGAYVAGNSYFVNEEPIYRAYGGEVGGEFFGFEGLDVYGNYAFEYIVEILGDASSVVQATPRHKLNGGIVYRAPLDIDFGMHGSWVDKQVWPIRSFDSSGQVVTTEIPLDGRVVLSNRLTWRPVDQLELSASAWNWLADLNGPQRQHPLGQPVGSRYTGSVTYRY